MVLHARVCGRVGSCPSEDEKARPKGRAFRFSSGINLSLTGATARRNVQEIRGRACQARGEGCVSTPTRLRRFGARLRAPRAPPPVSDAREIGGA
jgi:hypothetical protein